MRAYIRRLSNNKFSLKHVRGLSDVMHLTRALLAVLAESAIDNTWGDAVDFFKRNPRGLEAIARGDEFDMPSVSDLLTSPKDKATEDP